MQKDAEGLFPCCLYYSLLYITTSKVCLLLTVAEPQANDITVTVAGLHDNPKCLCLLLHPSPFSQAQLHSQLLFPSEQSNIRGQGIGVLVNQ